MKSALAAIAAILTIAGIADAQTFIDLGPGFATAITEDGTFALTQENSTQCRVHNLITGTTALFASVGVGASPHFVRHQTGPA